MSTDSLTRTLRVVTYAYVSLVMLTALTVAASLLHLTRGAAVAFALTVAAVKAAVIGWYFMHLRVERPLVWVVVVVGVVALAILVVGILPDLAWKYQ